MNIDKTHSYTFLLGAFTGGLMTFLAMLSVVIYSQYPGYKSVSIEMAAMVAKETRTHCETIKAKSFTLRADGLAIQGNCK